MSAALVTPLGVWLRGSNRLYVRDPVFGYGAGVIATVSYCVLPSKLQRLANTIDMLVGLSQESREVSVLVTPTLDTDEEFVLADAALGKVDGIRVSDRAFSGSIVRGVYFTEARKRYTVLDCVLAHEFGHGNDFRSEIMARTQCRAAKPVLKYLSPDFQDPWEAYAEAWQEWHLSRGATDNKAALWFARRNGWRTKW